MSEDLPVQAASNVLDGKEYDLPEYSGCPDGYAIVATPRSGSTLLCFLLITCGMMGVPHEYLSAKAHMPVMARRWGVVGPDDQIEPAKYLAAVVRWRTTPNGVFGAKAGCNEFARFARATPLRRYVKSARLIRIRRRDQIAQAVSLYRAGTTKFWSTTAKGARQPVVDYDGAAIARRLSTLRSEIQKTSERLSVNGLSALDVWYEELICDPDRVCRSVCAYVGVDPKHQFEIADAGPQRLSDDNSRHLQERFCADYHPHLCETT